MYVINKSVGWRDINVDQVLVVDCSTTQSYLLTHVSSLIWRNLETCSKEQIIQKVLDEFDINFKVAKNDFEIFIEALKVKKLIK